MHSREGIETREQIHNLTPAAAMDALAYFASPLALRNAIKSLENHEFTAWTTVVQDAAAQELYALYQCYQKNGPTAFADGE